MIGKSIKKYKIVRLIGSGGMGEVYKAQHRDLESYVAIKFINKKLAAKQDACDRFFNEARVAAKLNHPNICKVYDVGEENVGEGENEDRRLYIVMDFCEGVTLKRKLVNGPLLVTDAINIAMQIASGLGRAHRAGIVHRDIKSENIMITRDGVKILDFGLVKLLNDSIQTPSGVVLGTMKYMSPEQWKHQVVDSRTDVWSLGVVLFEMLTGHHPFEDRGGQVPKAAPLNKESKTLRYYGLEVSSHLEEIVARMLDREPGGRYGRMEDLYRQLELVKRDIGDSSIITLPLRPERTSSFRSQPRRSGQFKIGVTVLIFLAAAVIYLIAKLVSRPPAMLVLDPVQVTNAQGVEYYASWFPDGLMMAYMASAEGHMTSGNWDIFLINSSGGPPRNRTEDFLGMDAYPSVSPDGSLIAFWSERDDGGYFMMPALDGEPWRIAKTHSRININPPVWSKDGKTLACVVSDEDGASVKMIAHEEIETTGLYRVPEEISVGIQDLSWSPDGRFFAIVNASNPTQQAAQILIWRIHDGEIFEATDKLNNSWSPNWSEDGNWIYYRSNRSEAVDLWAQRVTTNGELIGEPRRLTNGVGIRHLAVSRDHQRIAYSQGRRIAKIWRVPIPKDAGPAKWNHAESILAEEAHIEFIDVSSDGKILLFDSDRSGNLELWELLLDSRDIRRLTANGAADWNPQISPGGNQIAFYSYRSGNRDIWIMPFSQGPPEQLTFFPGLDQNPSWSPDGKSVAFHSHKSGELQPWVIDLNGSILYEVATGVSSGAFPVWSPDGKWLAFISDQLIWKVPVQGGKARVVNSSPANYLEWADDGRIYFIGTKDQETNIWAVSPVNGHEIQVTEFNGKRGRLGASALAVDSEWVYFSWEADTGDLWVSKIQH